MGMYKPELDREQDEFNSTGEEDPDVGSRGLEVGGLFPQMD